MSRTQKAFQTAANVCHHLIEPVYWLAQGVWWISESLRRLHFWLEGIVIGLCAFSGHCLHGVSFGDACQECADEATEPFRPR